MLNIKKVSDIRVDDKVLLIADLIALEVWLL